MAKSRPGQASGSAVPTRLPSTRERRPALAALALLLIVGGALAAGWLSIRSGDRAYFVQVKSEVAQGQKITGDDVKSVSLPKDYSGGIPAGDKDTVVGKYATTRLLTSTVMTPAMVSKTAGSQDGKAQFGVSTPATATTANLTNGAPVALFIGSSDGASGPPGIRGEVVQVREADSGSSTAAGGDQVTLLVSVDISCGPALAQAVLDQQVTPALVGAEDKSQALRTTCGS